MSTHISGAAAHNNWHFSTPAATGNPLQASEANHPQQWHRPRPSRPDYQHTQPAWNRPHRPQPNYQHTQPGWNTPHRPQPDYQHTQPGWNTPHRPQPDYQHTQPGWNDPYPRQPDYDYAQPGRDYLQTTSRPVPTQPDYDDVYRTPYAERRPLQPRHRLSNR